MTELERVRGIGPTTAEKLKNAGFETIPLLSSAGYKDIIEKVALAPSVAQRLVETAREIVESELVRVKGVGPTIAKKLRTTGFDTIFSLANANRGDLIEKVALTPAVAQRLINAAQDIVEENKQEEKQKPPVAIVAEETIEEIEKEPLAAVADEAVEEIEEEPYFPPVSEILQSNFRGEILSSLKQELLKRVMKTPHLRDRILRKVAKGLFY
ncbi:MAG: DUF4332 domain-containing protein [Candidatus Marinimicrobia bacterium]|nr:DUF4332 domain-containing protein [Candidatus Neomarinimicrobiota bacterium]MCH8067998.1 DUF4332 domain-containing protein [Candidatus Neomarinimicrobiota bacterium]